MVPSSKAITSRLFQGESLCASTVRRGSTCSRQRRLSKYGSFAYLVERPIWESQAEQHTDTVLRKSSLNLVEAVVAISQSVGKRSALCLTPAQHINHFPQKVPPKTPKWGPQDEFIRIPWTGVFHSHYTQTLHFPGFFRPQVPIFSNLGEMKLLCWALLNLVYQFVMA